MPSENNRDVKRDEKRGRSEKTSPTENESPEKPNQLKRQSDESLPRTETLGARDFGQAVEQALKDNKKEKKGDSDIRKAVQAAPVDDDLKISAATEPSVAPTVAIAPSDYEHIFSYKDTHAGIVDTRPVAAGRIAKSPPQKSEKRIRVEEKKRQPAEKKQKEGTKKPGIHVINVEDSPKSDKIVLRGAWKQDKGRDEKKERDKREREKATDNASPRRQLTNVYDIARQRETARYQAVNTPTPAQQPRYEDYRNNKANREGNEKPRTPRDQQEINKKVSPLRKVYRAATGILRKSPSPSPKQTPPPPATASPPRPQNDSLSPQRVSKTNSFTRTPQRVTSMYDYARLARSSKNSPRLKRSPSRKQQP